MCNLDLLKISIMCKLKAAAVIMTLYKSINYSDYKMSNIKFFVLTFNYV